MVHSQAAKPPSEDSRLKSVVRSQDQGSLELARGAATEGLGFRVSEILMVVGGTRHDEMLGAGIHPHESSRR